MQSQFRKTQVPINRLRDFVLCLSACFSAGLVSAQLPSGAQVVAGQAQISSSGNVLTVQQNSALLATDWRSFNIGAGHTVNFVQPSSSSVALNRVVGNEVSRIQGALNANGQVFLLNPNGVLFTPTAQVNVGALVASTLKLDNQDFLAGRYRFSADGYSSSAIVNQGRITTAPGGSVALIAAKISNTGSITAPSGQVLMGAGSKVVLDLGGPVKLKVEEAALDALIEQGGAIKADGGLVYLSAKAAGQLASTVINHTGVTEARSLAEGPGGRIALEADSGITVAGGTLDVSSAGGVGGHISATSPRVLVPSGAQLDASGTLGGGLIQVGGGWQGHDNSIANAQAVRVLEDAHLHADALMHGDAGTVVVWSDGYTHFAGQISARGGPQGGNGGKVEVSGKTALGFTGKVDTSAARGQGGLLLLDPSNLTITDGSSGQTGTPSDWANTSLGGNYTIPETVLEGLTGDVVLTATADIIINNLSDNVLNLSANNVSFFANDESGASFSGGFTMRDKNDTIRLNQGAGKTLTLQGGSVTNVNSAGNSNAPFSASAITVGNIETAGASVVFNTKRASAADPIVVHGTIITNGGDVTVAPGTRFGLTNSSVVDVEFKGQVNTGGGSLTSNMTGTVKVNGGLNLGAGSATFGGTGTQINSLVESTSNVSISAPVSFGAGAGIKTSGNITFNSTASMLTGGSLTLTGNNFTFNNAFTGNSAAITLRPYSAATNIDIGTAGSGGGMVITQAALGQLNGFSNITIGRSDATGTTTVVSDTSVNASTRLELINSRIDITGGSVSNASGDVRLTGNQVNVARAVNGVGTISVQALDSSAPPSISTSGAGSLNAPLLELGSTTGPDLVIASDLATTAITSVLRSGGSITASAGGVGSANLAVQAGGAVTLTDTSFGFTTLALQAGGTVHARSSQAFDVGTLQGVSGVNASGQTVTLEATGSGTVSSSQAIIADGLVLRGGAAAFNLSGTTHTLNTLAADIGGALNLVNSGAMTLGQVSGTSGITTAGAINLATNTGNFVIERPIFTTDSSLSAVILNAGRSSDAGSATGGDLVFGSLGSVRTGTGGRATLYTGSLAGSTGLTSLVGSSSGRFRYNSDEISVGYDATLAPLGSGLNVLYREQPRIRVGFADQSMIYGESLLTPVRQLSGGVNGDELSSHVSGSASASVSGSTSNAGHVTAGGHDLVYTTGLSSRLGYGFEDDTSRNNELTVQARNLLLTGLSAVTRSYDGSNQVELTGSASASALPNDVVSVSGVASGQYVNANAGTAKVITLAGLSLSGADAANYTFSGGLTGTISQRLITVTADAKSKVYGNADPALTYAVTAGNLVGSDSLSGALTRASGSNVGSYAIDASSLANGNYLITAQNGVLSITPRPITVTADAKSKVYGNADPALTYAVTSGDLVGSDSLSGVLTRTAGSNVGNYAIDASALANGNYLITAQNGVLSITPRPITVTADAKIKVYGNADPALTYAVTAGDLVGSDSLSGVLTRTAGSNVGNYAIDASALANGNYLITAQNGVLSITPRPITVTADAKSKTYGEADPALSYQISSGNLVSGDRLGGALSRAAGESIGSHAISAQGLNNGNYAITAIDSSLVIAPAVNANVIAGNTPSATNVISMPPALTVPNFGNGAFTMIDVPAAPTASAAGDSSGTTARSAGAAPPLLDNTASVGSTGSLRMLVVGGGIKLPEIRITPANTQEGGKEQ